MSTPDVGRLDLSDEDTEDLFASPSELSKRKQKSNLKDNDGSNALLQRGGESKYDAEQVKEASLKRELESVRSINDVIEGVVSSLECANRNMETVSRTVTSASTLLNTWIRILSQTEHNQRLLLNPNWKGASQDVADMENEQVLKAQAAQRRAAEEDRRKEDAKRKVEEAERQRQAGTTAPARGVRGTRGRGRGAGRTGGLSSSGYVAGGSSGSASSGRGRLETPSRGGTGIGRGIGRGRARGVR